MFISSIGLSALALLVVSLYCKASRMTEAYEKALAERDTAINELYVTKLELKREYDERRFQERECEKARKHYQLLKTKLEQYE